MGDMGLMFSLMEILEWSGIGLGKYLMISKEELRNNEKDWMVTKWLKHKHQPVIHTLSYM